MNDYVMFVRIRVQLLNWAACVRVELSGGAAEVLTEHRRRARCSCGFALPAALLNALEDGHLTHNRYQWTKGSLGELLDRIQGLLAAGVEPRAGSERVLSDRQIRVRMGRGVTSPEQWQFL